MRGFLRAVCAVVTLCVVTRAHATQIIYESFNYTVGSNLKDQLAWDEPGGPTDTVLDKIIASNLTLPGIAPVGGALQTGGKFSFDSFVGANDNDPNSFLGGDGNTFWFSFIMKRTVAGNGDINNPDYGGLLLGSDPDTNKNLFIGKTGGGNGKYAIETENAGTMGVSNVSEVLGTQAFIVARLTFHDAGMEDAALFVNPSTTTPEGSLVPDATMQLEMSPFNDFFISTGTNAAWVFDELKIGTTYVDVAPEPASIALVMSSAALLARRRRGPAKTQTTYGA